MIVETGINISNTPASPETFREVTTSIVGIFKAAYENRIPEAAICLALETLKATTQAPQCVNVSGCSVGG